MNLCVRMGLPTGSPLDPVTRTLEDNPGLQELSWCGRTLPPDEKVFASAGHAVLAVYEMNGIYVYETCVERLSNLLLNNVREWNARLNDE